MLFNDVVCNSRNKLFETVSNFSYLGTNLTDQNFINDEVKSRLNSEDVCEYSVQNFFFVFRLDFQKYKNQNIQNYSFACYFCMGVKLGLSY